MRNVGIPNAQVQHDAAAIAGQRSDRTAADEHTLPNWKPVLVELRLTKWIRAAALLPR
jgi:hypothetical protein